MIGVGINENVVLVKAEILDNEGKKRLALTFDETSNVGQAKLDVFDSLQSAKVEDSRSGITLSIFPFRKPSGPKNETKTQDELFQMVGDDMARVKNQLTQVLELGLLTDDIKWDPYYNTGVTKDNYRTAFLDDDILAKIFENYCTQFIKMSQPIAGNKDLAMRMKLVRQSKEKHYATIPGRLLAEFPWVELMDVPKEQSRVQFTKYEKDNKLDDPTPVSQASADPVQSAAASTAGAAPAANLFGQR